jgi:hypothetical protein
VRERPWNGVTSRKLAEADECGLSDGRYRLRATADDSNWFKEADEDNNRTWVDP